MPKMTFMNLVNKLEEIGGTLELENVDHSLVLQVFKEVLHVCSYAHVSMLKGCA